MRRAWHRTDQTWKSLNRLCFFGVLLTALICCFQANVLFAGTQKAQSKKTTVTVADPYLASMTQFLAGDYCQVRSLRQISAGGGMSSVSGSKNGAIVLNQQQAQSLGIKNPVVLLDQQWQKGQKPTDYYFDPASLPFVLNRLQIALCELVPEGRSYYQRRLAEYETRLSSTIQSGRSQLNGKVIVDIGGQYAKFWKAAGCKVLSNDQAKLAIGTYLQTGSCAWENGAVVLDWTLSEAEKKRHISLPRAIIVTPLWGDDPLIALHQIYLQLGEVVSKKLK